MSRSVVILLSLCSFFIGTTFAAEAQKIIHENKGTHHIAVDGKNGADGNGHHGGKGGKGGKAGGTASNSGNGGDGGNGGDSGVLG
ncbi:hypothetical protein GQG54_005266, partial [Salmonella enterica]|nr:hypothetical protein [Salmonella enterica]